LLNNDVSDKPLSGSQRRKGMTLNYDEKRGFPRVNVQCDIQLTEVRSGDAFTAVCHDLSGGGVMFTSEKAMDVDAEYELVMEGGMGTPPLKAKIRVIRCDAEGDAYQVATRIQEILS